MNIQATRAKPQSPSASERDMANAIRALAMDAVQKANSGHPGMPMGMADVATVLFNRFIKLDPSSPTGPDRDRFVLSAGHGSMLQYAIHHLLGYEDMPYRAVAAIPPARQPYRPAIRNTAMRSASRRRPDRWGRASPPPSAWRSPNG
jgi:hypothetical protein